jgi:hypothetical protein
MGAPTSSYATAGIALRVSGALKPHHYDKVETPSVGLLCTLFQMKNSDIVVISNFKIVFVFSASIEHIIGML